MAASTPTDNAQACLKIELTMNYWQFLRIQQFTDIFTLQSKINATSFRPSIDRRKIRQDP